MPKQKFILTVTIELEPTHEQLIEIAEEAGLESDTPSEEEIDDAFDRWVEATEASILDNIEEFLNLSNTKISCRAE